VKTDPKTRFGERDEMRGRKIGVAVWRSTGCGEHEGREREKKGIDDAGPSVSLRILRRHEPANWRTTHRKKTGKNPYILPQQTCTAVREKKKV